MARKRIIPCLDIRDGQVVKGVKFDQIRQVAQPIDLARSYTLADELVIYDITASLEGRTFFMDQLDQIIQEVRVPVTVGGGISTLEDIERVLKAGASKVSINSAAIKDPKFIQRAADHFGSGQVVLSMDVKKLGEKYHLFARGGREDTGTDALKWADLGQDLGAGELVINSIDADGVREGFDIPMLQAIGEEVSLPIIASGGAGKMEDFAQVFKLPQVVGGLAASIFHHKEVDIGALKKYLKDQGVPVEMGGKVK